MSKRKRRTQGEGWQVCRKTQVDTKLETLKLLHLKLKLLIKTTEKIMSMINLFVVAQMI